ncbi:hypothetical protein HK405_003451, partial [Cladochytrium tenue]
MIETSRRTTMWWRPEDPRDPLPIKPADFDPPALAYGHFTPLLADPYAPNELPSRPDEDPTTGADRLDELPVNVSEPAPAGGTPAPAPASDKGILSLGTGSGTILPFLPRRCARGCTADGPRFSGDICDKLGAAPIVCRLKPGRPVGDPGGEFFWLARRPLPPGPAESSGEGSGGILSSDEVKDIRALWNCDSRARRAAAEAAAAEMAADMGRRRGAVGLRFGDVDPGDLTGDKAPLARAFDAVTGDFTGEDAPFTLRFIAEINSASKYDFSGELCGVFADEMVASVLELPSSSDDGVFGVR